MRTIETFVLASAAVALLASTALAQSDIAPRTAVSFGGVWEARSFIDPTMNVGGGLRFNVNEHLMVRPDIRALVVFGDDDTHTLGVFGVQLGYRF